MIKELLVFALIWMLSVGIVLGLAKRDNERVWVNHLADQSRKADAVRSYRRRAHVQRPAYKYAAVYTVARK